MNRRVFIGNQYTSLEVLGDWAVRMDNDTWTYQVDSGSEVVGGAYFESTRDNFGFGYRRKGFPSFSTCSA